MRENKSLAALLALLRTNDDAGDGLLRIGTDLKFAIPTDGLVTDVGDVESCGESFLIALAMAEVDIGDWRLPAGGSKPQPVPVAFLFDREGRLKRRFGSRTAKTQDLSQTTRATSFGTPDSWFVWVTRFDMTDPTFRLRISDVYLVAGKVRQVLALRHQHYGAMYTNAAIVARDCAYLGFTLERAAPGKRPKLDGVARDGAVRRARLEWDPQRQAFHGPSRIEFNDQLVYEVDVEKSDGFEATDMPGSQ